MKVEISNLTIKVDKKKLTLSLLQAKALFDELNTIFGPKYTWNYSPFVTYTSQTLGSSGSSEKINLNTNEIDLTKTNNSTTKGDF